MLPASHPTQPISARPVTAALGVRVDDYLFLQLRPEECSFEVLAADVRVIRRWEGMGACEGWGGGRVMDGV